jgi:hypothetical protein
VPLGPFLRSNGRSEGKWFFSWCDAADNVGTFGRRTHARVKTVLPSPQQLCQYLPWSIYWPAEIQIVMQSARKVMVRALRQGEAVCDRKLCKELAACRNCVGERCYLSMCPVERQPRANLTHSSFRAAGRCSESKPAQRDTARDQPVATGQG